MLPMYYMHINNLHFVCSTNYFEMKEDTEIARTNGTVLTPPDLRLEYSRGSAYAVAK